MSDLTTMWKENRTVLTSMWKRNIPMMLDLEVLDTFTEYLSNHNWDIYRDIESLTPINIITTTNQITKIVECYLRLNKCEQAMNILDRVLIQERIDKVSLFILWELCSFEEVVFKVSRVSPFTTFIIDKENGNFEKIEDNGMPNLSGSYLMNVDCLPTKISNHVGDNVAVFGSDNWYVVVRVEHLRMEWMEE